jgi:hypothetical protein
MNSKREERLTKPVLMFSHNCSTVESDRHDWSDGAEISCPFCDPFLFAGGTGRLRGPSSASSLAPGGARPNSIPELLRSSGNDRDVAVPRVRETPIVPPDMIGEALEDIAFAKGCRSLRVLSDVRSSPSRLAQLSATVPHGLPGGPRPDSRIISGHGRGGTVRFPARGNAAPRRRWPGASSCSASSRANGH